MTLNRYCKDRKLSKTTLQLIDKLKAFSEGDEEFILGVLIDLKSDDEREIVIKYIDEGNDVSYENIILVALELNQQRNNNIL